MRPAHDRDYYSWTQEQAALLRARRFDLLDIERLAAAVEDIGRTRNESRDISARLAVVIGFLLRLQVQQKRTDGQTQIWRVTVNSQRHQLARYFYANPELGESPKGAELLAAAWEDGRLLAVRQSGLDDHQFPKDCPFTIAQIIEPDFWP